MEVTCLVVAKAVVFTWGHARYSEGKRWNLIAEVFHKE